jgi:peptidyl-Lys metalloendopeptidase
MSHFNVTAGTSDWAYGKTACLSLAQTDPAHALDNADSHEYFAENTPALP